MVNRSPQWCGTLATVLASLALPLAACSKKKGSSATDTTSTVATTTTTETTTTSGDVTIDNAVVADAGSLVIPAAINLIPPKSESGAGLRLTSDDYSLDKTNTRLKEDMFEPVDQAVGILCFVSQTRGIEFLNKGAYKAFVDEAACGMSHNDQQGAVSYKPVTVLATQEGNKPPKIQMWLSGGEGEEGGGAIQAELVMAEGPTESNPLGVLKMRWAQGESGGGYIETRKFANPDGDGRDRAELLFQESGSHGSDISSSKAFASLYVKAGSEPTDGYVSTSSSQTGSWNGQTHTQASNYKAAFNAANVSRTGSTSADGTEESADACLDRNAFINYVERYNLYTADTGARVELNSGRPGVCTADGKEVQANFSYWGIWNSANASSSALTDCKFVDYTGGNRTETPVELVTAPGKLVKYTRAQTTLGAIKGVELTSYSQGGSLIIKWTGDTDGFQKVATETCDNNGCSRTAATGAVTATNPWDNSINFYVPSLDANMGIRLTDASDAFVIYYFNRETVSGTANVPTGDLVCYNNCPKMAPSATEMQWMGGGDATSSPYHTTTISYGNGQSQASTSAQNLSGSALATYTFDSSALVLKEGSTAFALPSGLSESSNLNLSSGALVPTADFAALTSQQRSQSSGWDIERLLTTFYRWESGSSPWSQFAGVKQGGNYVNFDKPIDLAYNFAAADNINTTFGEEFYGAPVRLTYGGVGNLWGIPQDKTSRMPKFSMKAGVTIGSYMIKPIQVSQQMSSVAASTCSGLAVERAPNLDSLPAFVAPTAEAAPSGELELKVIGGELVSP